MVQVIAGRYELVEVLGRGGMGAVWRAQDRMLGREVAVKEVSLPQGLDDAQVERVYARTFREARSAARLDHPGIVTVHDVVEEDGRPWIVMQLVRAEALDKVIAREGPLAPARAAAVGLDVLDALTAAHAAGVVHRDVKPGNVLLPGRAVLTDFGIATVQGDETLTQTGAIVGSPAYLAPEQARYQKATPASDLWSLGATLYAAVEGRPPFKRPDVWGVMAAVLSDDPDPMERAGPLAPVLRGLLQKDPDARMGAEEAGRLLRQVAQGAPSPVEERPSPVPERPSPSREAPRFAPAGGPFGPRDVTMEPPPPETTVPSSPTSSPAPPHTSSPPSPPRRRPPWPLIIPAGVVAAVLAVAAVAIVVFVVRGEENKVPDGYRLYQGSTYTVHIPKGWQEQNNADNVSFKDPTKGVERGVAIQRVSSAPVAIDAGDALADAAGDMKDDPDYPGYEQEKFVRNIPYLGGQAAELQFTFTKDGVPGRARVRVFKLSGVLYQVVLICDQKHWEASGPYFETVLKSLRPAS